MSLLASESPDPAALGERLQHLKSDGERVLTLGSIADGRGPGGGFAPADLAELFLTLRVPAPKNLSQVLSRLEARREVLRLSTGRWALTPIGRKRAVDLAAGIEPASIEPALAGIGGAVFEAAVHHTIPPNLAPVKWAKPIARLLERFPFETNVFCMTRFPDDEADPLSTTIHISREVLREHGLNLHLASDRQADDELHGNVVAHMWACKYGLGLLEDHRGRGLNYNVVIELGSMLVIGRRCVMLKDVTAPDLPTDLAGHIYRSADFTDEAAIAESLNAWVRKDLGLKS